MAFFWRREFPATVGISSHGGANFSKNFFFAYNHIGTAQRNVTVPYYTNTTPLPSQNNYFFDIFSPGFHKNIMLVSPFEGLFAAH